ncbi:MAG TPA: hypothetical protein VN256_01420 [Pyrinomonadaceae bacterium]|nr:hypothetical protein [Pyrinomonadaceae bacterium]
MNEDYLWDKTGEADPEIERLEQKLSSLRFKRPAEPLPLPAAAPRNLFRLSFPRPALAAAATLLVLLLAGGLWLGLSRRTASTNDQDAVATGTAPEEKRIAQPESGPRPPIGPELPPNVTGPRGGEIAQTAPQQAPVVRPRPQRRPPAGARQLIVHRRAPRSVSPRQEELARRGEEAKEQLIKALHIAGDRLNKVQKKIQDNQEQGPIS